jgi:hypothetical protein
MCAASAVAVGRSAPGAGGRAAHRPRRQPQRGQRAIERDDALVDVARELLQALIGGCGQPERAACGAVAWAMHLVR